MINSPSKAGGGARRALARLRPDGMATAQRKSAGSQTMLGRGLRKGKNVRDKKVGWAGQPEGVQKRGESTGAKESNLVEVAVYML